MLCYAMPCRCRANGTSSTSRRPSSASPGQSTRASSEIRTRDLLRPAHQESDSSNLAQVLSRADLLWPQHQDRVVYDARARRPVRRVSRALPLPRWSDARGAVSWHVGAAGGARGGLRGEGASGRAASRRETRTRRPAHPCAPPAHPPLVQHADGARPFALCRRTFWGTTRHGVVVAGEPLTGAEVLAPPP